MGGGINDRIDDFDSRLNGESPESGSRLSARLMDWLP
jgi:hypothetical protein